MRRFAAEGALVAAAFFFGVTFPLVHDALEDVTPFAYLVLRFGVAVLALGPFAIAIVRRRGDDRRLLVRVGLVAGLLMFGGYATQTVGLQYTTPSTSAFITGLYVMFTPFVEAVIRRAWPGPRIFVSAVLATVGLYLLTGADLGGIGRGELLTLACAFLFAIWIVYQGAYAARLHPIPFTTMQMVTLVVVGAPGHGPPGRRRAHTARCGSRSCSPASRARRSRCRCSSGASAASRRRVPVLILLMEPVFAGLAGYRRRRAARRGGDRRRRRSSWRPS